MYQKLFDKKEELLENWIKSIELDLDESEVRYQFGKLFDVIIAHLKNEDVDEHLSEFVDDMIKYEVSPKEIATALETLLFLIEKLDLNDKEILEVNKVVYSLALRIFEFFDKKRLELISSQLKVIKQMEIPILKLDKESILVPLIGFIDSQKALSVMRKILETIKKEETLKVIIDIEGIPVIDTEVANQFLRIYRGIKAMGAKMVLSGVTPAVAETMVHLEIDLPIPTKANLELAIKAFKDEI